MRLLISSAVTIVLASPVTAQPGYGNRTFVYRGYSIDMSAIAPGLQAVALRRAAQRQVDIVAQAPLRPRIARWLTRVPIKIMAGQHASPGQYTGQPMLVRLWLRPTPDDRPLLLHELMHAVHNNLLPGRLNNPEILRFYRVAQQRGYWPGQYVMSNKKEYFAVTASLLLHGTIDRPPRNRATLERMQPLYAQWLRRTLTY